MIVVANEGDYCLMSIGIVCWSGDHSISLINVGAKACVGGYMHIKDRHRSRQVWVQRRVAGGLCVLKRWEKVRVLCT